MTRGDTVRKPGSMEVIGVKKYEKKMAGCAFPWRPEGHEPMHIAPIKRDEDGRPPRVMVKATAGPSGRMTTDPGNRKGRVPLVDDWNLGVERFQLSLSTALFDAKTGIRRTGKRL
jgi:hypothetical protein